jgi:hypothetical protein
MRETISRFPCIDRVNGSGFRVMRHCPWVLTGSTLIPLCKNPIVTVCGGNVGTTGISATGVVTTGGFAAGDERAQALIKITDKAKTIPLKKYLMISLYKIFNTV